MIQDSKELREQTLMLHMMTRIEKEPEVSQRALSSHLGVAIGLVNTYLKRCIHKGWIKVKDIPAKRYAYYLTPKGFIEKARITTEYLSSGFKFFREARHEFMTLFKECEQKNWKHVLLVGSGDLAEIAYQISKETSLQLSVKSAEEILALYESEHDTLNTKTLNVKKEVNTKNWDVVIITDMRTPQTLYELMHKHYAEDKILTPSLLHISRVSQV